MGEGRSYGCAGYNEGGEERKHHDDGDCIRVRLRWRLCGGCEVIVRTNEVASNDGPPRSTAFALPARYAIKKPTAPDERKGPA